eukprot:jgi/Mesvir1/6522/Mv16787-RA.1
MASRPGAPVQGVEYPVVLGDTFLQRNGSSRKYFTLRYHFKPESIDTAAPGLLTQCEDKEVEVEFKNKEAEKPRVIYKGNHEQCKDLDYLVLFDGKSMRFERLTDSIKNLRHVRATESARERGTVEAAAWDLAGTSDWGAGAGRQEQGSQGSAPASGDDEEVPRVSPAQPQARKGGRRPAETSAAPTKRAKSGGATTQVTTTPPPSNVTRAAGQGLSVSPEPARRFSSDNHTEEEGDVGDDDGDDDEDGRSEDVDIDDHIDVGEEEPGLSRVNTVPAVVIDRQEVASASSSEDEDSSDDDSSDDDDTSSDDDG